MDIDLTTLHNQSVSYVDISGSYTLDESYFQNTDIIRLDDIEVNGRVEERENEDLELEDCIICSIDGIMVIPDSISLEEIEYPFHIEYDDYVSENCRKSENVLDILAFLWENIVLEVPLQFTKVRDLSKFQGDGWKLIREEERVLENNPFRDLLKDFEEE